jgi:hypothetical protein
MDGALCPSVTAEPGVILLGVVQADGRVGYVSTPLRVDEDFVRRVEAEGNPAKRYRFAGPCIEAGCAHWQAGGCDLPDAVADLIAEREDDEALPHCSIRSSCRWYRQSGQEACRSCALVLTDPD